MILYLFGLGNVQSQNFRESFHIQSFIFTNTQGSLQKQIYKKINNHNKALMTQATTTYASSTLMGRQQKKKVAQLLQSLLDLGDSADFRNPVDWKAFNLIDYPIIIKKPMDLGTVKKNLNNGQYETVEDCLKDIDLIWTNCKTYNKDNPFYLKLADKMDKTTKKMIKNYLAFVIVENASKQKKLPPAANTKKQIPKKPTTKQPQQPKTYQDRKQNQIQQQAKEQDTPQTKMRKDFLFFVPLCTSEQIGVMFLLIQKNQPESIDYTEDGNVKIQAERMSDKLVKRLIDQMDMWGIGYVSAKKK